MISSMTGYATHHRDTNNGVLQIELRSVNQRYLELQFKIDEQLRAQEPQLRELLKEKLGRGKVECRINLVKAGLQDAGIELNHDFLKQLATSVKAASEYFLEVQAINILEVLSMPGVMLQNVANQDAFDEDVLIAITTATDDLIASRQREGEKLKIIILERLAEVESLVLNLKPKMPILVKCYQDKLLSKLQDAQQSCDDDRIRQEVLLYTQRIDVDEELSRLDSHVHEVKRILAKGGLVGKKLDFLMQEMNREANTLGSKSVSIETTQISMQLKVLIEQMREQIQNIE